MEELTHLLCEAVQEYVLLYANLEILIKCTCIQALSLATFIALVISLAANSSIVLPETSSLNNISVDITILGGAFLQRSVNIFGGIFAALSALAVFHSIEWMIVLFLNIGYVNKNWLCFGRIVS